MGTKNLRRKKWVRIRKKIGYEKFWVQKKSGFEKVWVRKKFGYEKKIGYKKKLGTKNFRYGKKLGERESSTCGELDPHSHIFGPFRQTSDKFLEGNSMNTHFGSGNAVLPTRVKM